MSAKRTIGYFIFNTIFTISLATFLIFIIGFARCFIVFPRIPSFENYKMMRVLIYGRSETSNLDTVSAVISILDTDGNECAVIERSWKGSSLVIDFRSAEFLNKIFYFPQSIYARKTISEKNNYLFKRRGIQLAKYYNENKQCILFGANMSYESRKNLYVLSNFATNTLPIFTAGFSRIYSVDLSQCEPGAYYSIFVDMHSSLRIEKMY